MANVNSRNGLLFFDFRHQGVRCREYTKLSDTTINRRKMGKVMQKIEAERTLGQFDYAKWFPGSKNIAKFDAPKSVATAVETESPLFSDFAELWFSENQLSWRRSHTATQRSTLDRHLIPYFGDMPVSSIDKPCVLAFRASLGKLKGRGANASLSPKTINRIIQILGQILSESAERFGGVNPVDKIKRLKQPRVDIQPFSLSEVRTMIDTVRADFRDYLVVRFFTGMRTGEIHGLKWKYVDFERREILIRETLVRGECEYTKTDGSQREIEMSQPVFEALERLRSVSGDAEYVFVNAKGEPFDVDNITNRLWYPLLRHLGLEKRRPYQTRHTAATLWLGAGENPEWVARQLGHSNTLMLFQVYSRYVPNLTRQDGAAFDNLLRQRGLAVGALA